MMSEVVRKSCQAWEKCYPPRMAYKVQPLGMMVTLDPDKARAEIIEAYTKAGASLTDAASRLECSMSSLLRWIDSLGMMAEIRGLKKKAKREGWHHDRNSLGGRPVGSTKKRRNVA